MADLLQSVPPKSSASTPPEPPPEPMVSGAGSVPKPVDTTLDKKDSVLPVSPSKPVTPVSPVSPDLTAKLVDSLIKQNNPTPPPQQQPSPPPPPPPTPLNTAPKVVAVPPVSAAPPPSGSSTIIIPSADKARKAPKPPKSPGKSGGGKLIIFLVLFFLLIGTPIGVYFISQQQNITQTENRAADSSNSPYPTPTPFDGGCEGGSWNNSCHVCAYNANLTCGGPGSSGGDPCTINGVSVSCTWVNMWRCDCGNGNWVAARNTTFPNCAAMCDCAIPCDTCGPTTTPGNPPPPSDTPPTFTPTNTPLTQNPTNTPISGQCDSIKVYKNNVVVEPSTLRVGDSVVIAVAGTNATKARLRLQPSSTWEESTDKNTSGEYTFTWVVPAGVTSFVFESEVFINGAWQ